MGEKIKPCPLCGEPVDTFEKPSPDGTITWIAISHGPSTPCGISFIGDQADAIKQWNTRNGIDPDELEMMKRDAHNGLPDDCVAEWDEVKFCHHRQGDGKMCKKCSHYQ